MIGAALSRGTVAAALSAAALLTAPAAPPSGSPPPNPPLLPALVSVAPEPETRKRPAYRPLH